MVATSAPKVHSAPWPTDFADRLTGWCALHKDNVQPARSSHNRRFKANSFPGLNVRDDGGWAAGVQARAASCDCLLLRALNRRGDEGPREGFDDERSDRCTRASAIPEGGVARNEANRSQRGRGKTPAPLRK